jgi:hypothetical protein
MASKKQQGKTPAATSSDRIPADAARAALVDLEGAEHTLAQTWKDRPVVLVFLRHFG